MISFGVGGGEMRICWRVTVLFNPLTPNDLYISRTAPLTSKRCILYIYSTNVGTEYFKHALYSPFFSSSKCSLFHNANFFGSCIIHILYTGCAEIKKNNFGAKGLIKPRSLSWQVGRLRYCLFCVSSGLYVIRLSPRRREFDCGWGIYLCTHLVTCLNCAVNVKRFIILLFVEAERQL